ncbi:hypothetical protein [Candidatus Electrothrix sp.]|uniref:hypothetical protein n=1 Tax=Candidatus Electrothrix sp. TaxID=2170559 RepID=UPI004055DB46
MLLILGAVLVSPFSGTAFELNGSIALEGQYFLEEPGFLNQEEHTASVAAKAEFYHSFSTGVSLVFKPFVRLDSNADERSHWDIREANFLYPIEGADLQVGIGKVFWGAAEFVHLVDIINQTDLVEGIDEEEKLGQPMLRLSLFQDWGLVDLFLLPWFRERNFPGEKDRLRTPFVIDTDQTLYESSSEEQHVDLALRYSSTFGDADIGLYQFIGTSREPTLIMNGQPDRPVLLPYYEQIRQTGLDLQMTAGSWLLKGEVLYRSGQGRNFAAAVAGFEYTFFSMYETSMDLGLIGEYVFDDRESRLALSSFNNDIMVGFRLALNDAAGTELLGGVIKDLELSTCIFSLEAGRRISERIKLNAEALLISAADEQDPAYWIEKDSYILLELVYFF